ncbi:MAG TPA: CPBP family intramembrane glutamic endopeptidase [Anaerolineae bacterium]|nr:CPBP family intramembrane glutamic endopeptidase [Anaerolineae bacterium]
MSTEKTAPRTGRKALVFVILTFASSWLIAGGYYALGGRLNQPLAIVVLLVYMFVPMTAAIIVQKVIYRQPLRAPLAISFRPNRWFLVAWFLFAIAALATIGVSVLLPGVEYSAEMAGFFERFASSLTPEQLAEMKAQMATMPIHPLWIGMVQGLIAGVTINAVAAFGEELGWRGLLQRELLHLGFWKSSGLIGLIWGIWHAPIIIQGYNYPQHPLAGVAMMTVFTVLLSPILGYVTLKAKSVIVAAIAHGTLNGTAGVPLMVLLGGNDLTVGITGLAGFVVLALINLAIFVFQRLQGDGAGTAKQIPD